MTSNPGNSDKSSSPQSDDQGRWQESSDLRSVLEEMSSSLDGITSAHGMFEVCSEQLWKVPSQEPIFQQDVDDLLFKLQIHEDEQRFILDDIEHGLSENISRQVEYALYDSDQLLTAIREETTQMVKDEVDEQLVDFLPVSLQDMAEESRRQLRVIQTSLKNSYARRCNSNIEFMHLDDPLKPVLTPSGETSPLYPQNVQILLNYDLPTAKALSKDYELAETEDLQTNFQQFLKHIGTRVSVVVPEDGVTLDSIGQDG